MCVDVDLFGEVIILKDDVELWLNECTRFDAYTPFKRKQQYIKDRPIASIVAHAKLDGSFYEAKDRYLDNMYILELEKLQAFPTRYVECGEKLVERCPDYYHECSVQTCPIYIRRTKLAYTRKMYLKRKAQRAHL
jgi:hypothetical protein